MQLMKEEFENMVNPKKYSAARIAIEKHNLAISAKYLIKLREREKAESEEEPVEVKRKGGREPVLSDRLKNILRGIVGEHLIHHELVNYKLIQSLAKKYLMVGLSKPVTYRFKRKFGLVSKRSIKKPKEKISQIALTNCYQFRDEVTSACTDTTKLYAMDETALYSNEVVPRTLVEIG